MTASFSNDSTRGQIERPHVTEKGMVPNLLNLIDTTHSEVNVVNVFSSFTLLKAHAGYSWSDCSTSARVGAERTPRCPPTTRAAVTVPKRRALSK